MPKPNFRIVENAPKAYEEHYEEFIELYENTDMTVYDIRTKLGWSTKTFQKARNKAKEEGRISPRNRSRNYYYNKWNGGKWIVRKSVNGVTHRYTVATEEEAIELRDYLNYSGWSDENVREFRKRYKCI